MSTTLGSLCKNILWISQTVLKMWLWTWTQTKFRIQNFCWISMISQNSSRWRLWVAQSRGTQNWIGSGLVRGKCHVNTYSKSPGHYYIKYTLVYGPNFQRKGQLVWQRSQKEGSTGPGEKWIFFFFFFFKRSFQKFWTKHILSRKFVKSFQYFLNKLVIS